jgi:hypothetical protein
MLARGPEHGELARPACGGYPSGEVWLACKVVEILGGRYSTELGIDVDAGDAGVERWFLAATLFGARISARIAERTFSMLTGAGLVRIGQVRHVPSADLIGLLDAGGYARYDFRTANRLLALAELIGERYDGEVAVIGRRFPAYPGLSAALGTLPGWGPVTIRLFLRELRGVWPGAQPPVDERAAAAAAHLGLLGPGAAGPQLAALGRLAKAAGLDLRDLESALVRLALAHGRVMPSCPAGQACTALHQPARRPQ